MSCGPQLHETRMGQRLFEHTLPELVHQLTRIADALESLAPANDPPKGQPKGGEPR